MLYKPFFKPAVLVLLALLICAFSACGNTTGNASSTPHPSAAESQADIISSILDASATATASSAPVYSATTTPGESPAPTLSATATPGVTETRMGYVRDADSGSPNTITIDYIDFYTGDEAIEMALADGSDVVEYDGGVPYIPNDYYIRNVNPMLRTFPVSEDCSIMMLPEEGGAEPMMNCIFEFFEELVNERDRLVTVEVVDGIVVSITEFYIP